MSLELTTFFPHAMEAPVTHIYDSLSEAAIKTKISYHFLYNCLNSDNNNNFANFFKLRRIDPNGNELPANRKGVKMIRGSRNEQYRQARLQVEQKQSMYHNFNDKSIEPSLRENRENYELETNSLLNLKKRMLQSLTSEAAYS